MRIVLSGGGTGGSVMPLLAVAEEIKKQEPSAEFLFVGTRKGVPEKELVQNVGMTYRAIFSGKLRRYFSLKNLVDPFLILFGFFQSVFLILKFRPQAILSAGGFVAVPLSLAGWLLGVPIFIHQQDIVPGLANRIIVPLARRITVSFSVSMENFEKKKTVLTGNPVRPEIFQGKKEEAVKIFGLEENVPVLLVKGGSTGAKDLNELIFKIIPQLTNFCQIIHLTGPGKMIIGEKADQTRHHQAEFLIKEMADVYQVADLVVCRAGLGTLTELSILRKPIILVPIPDSHQEVNAEYFQKEADVIVLSQKTLTPEILLEEIRNLIQSPDDLKQKGEKIFFLARPQAAEEISQVILREIN